MSDSDESGQHSGDVLSEVQAYVERVGDMIDGSKERLAQAATRLAEVGRFVRDAISDVSAALQTALDALQADLDAARESLVPPAEPELSQDS